MNNNEAIPIIRENWRQIIGDITTPAKQKANHETSWICPFCGHGSGGDGLTFNPKSKDGNGLKCFSCSWSGDIIELYQKVKGVDFKEALSLLADKIGLRIEEPTTAAPSAPRQADFTAYYNSLKNIPYPSQLKEYLAKRGISIATAANAGLLFDPASDPANAPGAIGDEFRPHPCPRLIIPTGNAHYVGRRIDGVKEFEKLNASGTTPGIMNEEALYSREEVFVCEGAFSALSFMEIGYPAIAINSASNSKKFIDALKKRKPKAKLMLCLDNDPAGAKATNEIMEACKAMGIECMDAGGQILAQAPYNDPNDALVGDLELFKKSAEQAFMSDILQNTVLGLGESFEAYVGDKRNFEAYSTGIYALDKFLNGGLYPKIYVLAASPGAGKTTLALQIADKVASSGKNVLFFSMEMGTEALIAKSISRESYLTDKSKAKTELEVYNDFSEVRGIWFDYVKKVGSRLSHYKERRTADDINSIVRTYARKTGTRPLVIVDYLQFIDPDGKETREAVNHSMNVFEGIRDDLKCPILLISSMSRSNYGKGAADGIFKESGNIEYGGDALMMLDYDIDLTPGEKESQYKYEARIRKTIADYKTRTPRPLRISMIKTRLGGAGDYLSISYFSAHNYFTVDPYNLGFR